MIEQNEITEQNIVKKIHIKGFEGTFMNLIFTFITAEEGRPCQKLASYICRKVCKQTWVALVVSKLCCCFQYYKYSFIIKYSSLRSLSACY